MGLIGIQPCLPPCLSLVLSPQQIPTSTQLPFLFMSFFLSLPSASTFTFSLPSLPRPPCLPFLPFPLFCSHSFPPSSPQSPFSFLSFSSFPLPHSPSRYSRTIEQMAGCLFYMSLWKISSAVESATFAKNRHRPIQLNAREKGEGVGRPCSPYQLHQDPACLHPTPCHWETSLPESPERSFSPAGKAPWQAERAWPASTVSLTPAKVDGDVGKVGQCGRGRLLSAHPSCSLPQPAASPSVHGSRVRCGVLRQQTWHRVEADTLCQPHVSSYATGGATSEKPPASNECVGRGRQSLPFSFWLFPLFCEPLSPKALVIRPAQP